jgi:hypothetical protein
MEAVRSSETLVNFYPTALRHMPEDGALNIRRSEIHNSNGSKFMQYILLFTSNKNRYIYIKLDHLKIVFLGGHGWDLFILHVPCNL